MEYSRLIKMHNWYIVRDNKIKILYKKIKRNQYKFNNNEKIYQKSLKIHKKNSILKIADLE